MTSGRGQKNDAKLAPSQPGLQMTKRVGTYIQQCFLHLVALSPSAAFIETTSLILLPIPDKHSLRTAIFSSRLSPSVPLLSFFCDIVSMQSHREMWTHTRCFFAGRKSSLMMPSSMSLSRSASAHTRLECIGSLVLVVLRVSVLWGLSSLGRFGGASSGSNTRSHGWTLRSCRSLRGTAWNRDVGLLESKAFSNGHLGDQSILLHQSPSVLLIFANDAAKVVATSDEMDWTGNAGLWCAVRL